MQGHGPIPPSPWELPCPQPDTSPAARPGFRHPAIPPRSSVSGKQGTEAGAAKANTGSGNCCSGSSPLAGSCKSPVRLPVPPRERRHPAGPICYGKWGRGAPCNVLHPCSSLSPGALHGCAGEGWMGAGHSPQPCSSPRHGLEMRQVLQNRNAGSARAWRLWGAFGHGGIPRAQAAGRAAGTGATGFPFPGSDPNGMQSFPRHRGLGSMVSESRNGLCVFVFWWGSYRDLTPLML